MGRKHEASLSYTVPCLSVVYKGLSKSSAFLAVSVPSLSCWDVTDPTSEDREISNLDWKCASQVGYVYNRQVCFQVQSVSVASLSGGGVLVLNQDRTGSSSIQDSNSVGQDRKWNRQALNIHDRMVSRRAEPQSGCRVMEGQWNTKHVWYFADPLQQARKLQLTLTDSVNIAPDPRTIPTYQQVGSSGTPPLGRIILEQTLIRPPPRAALM